MKRSVSTADFVMGSSTHKNSPLKNAFPRLTRSTSKKFGLRLQSPIRTSRLGNSTQISDSVEGSKKSGIPRSSSTLSNHLETDKDVAKKVFGGSATAARAEARRVITSIQPNRPTCPVLSQEERVSTPVSIKKPDHLNHIKFDFALPNLITKVDLSSHTEQSPTHSANKRRRCTDDEGRAGSSKRTNLSHSSSSTFFAVPSDPPTVTYLNAIKSNSSNTTAAPITIRSPPTSPSRSHKVQQQSASSRPPPLAKPAYSEESSILFYPQSTSQHSSLPVSTQASTNSYQRRSTSDKWTGQRNLGLSNAHLPTIFASTDPTNQSEDNLLKPSLPRSLSLASFSSADMCKESSSRGLLPAFDFTLSSQQPSFALPPALSPIKESQASPTPSASLNKPFALKRTVSGSRLVTDADIDPALLSVSRPSLALPGIGSLDLPPQMPSMWTEVSPFTRTSNQIHSELLNSSPLKSTSSSLLTPTAIIPPSPEKQKSFYIGSAVPAHSVQDQNMPRLAFVDATPSHAKTVRLLEDTSSNAGNIAGLQVPALEQGSTDCGGFVFASSLLRNPASTMDTMPSMQTSCSSTIDDESLLSSCDTTMMSETSFSTDGMSQEQANRLAELSKKVSALANSRRLSGSMLPPPASNSFNLKSQIPVRTAPRSLSTSALSTLTSAPLDSARARLRSGSFSRPSLPGPSAKREEQAEKARRASAGALRRGSLLPLASSSSALSALGQAGCGTSVILSDQTKALAPLKDVVAYVDVRTAEGDDASAVFVEMLKSLGARVSHIAIDDLVNC